MNSVVAQLHMQWVYMAVCNSITDMTYHVQFLRVCYLL